MNFDQANDLQSHRDYLRRYAVARTHDPSAAEDLVQESLTRALTYARGGKPIKNLRAYLFAILKNVLADKWSRKRRSVSVVPMSDDIDCFAEAPSQIAHMQWIELIEAIENLPAAQRRVMVLVGLEGVPYRSAAEIMKIPIGTVMSRLNRGRAALRRTIFDETQSAEHATRRAAGKCAPQKCPASGKRLQTQDKFSKNEGNTTLSFNQSS